MKKLKIAVDLDEVLAQTHMMIIEFHNKVYGTNCVPSDFTSNSYCKVWNCSSQECARRVEEFMKSKYWLSHILPVPGSLKALQKLKDSFELVIVTSRPASVSETTIEFIHNHYPNIFSQIYFGGGTYIKNLSEIYHTATYYTMNSEDVYPTPSSSPQSSSALHPVYQPPTSIFGHVASCSANEPNQAPYLPKSDICKLLNVCALVDDCFQNAIDAAQCGIHAFLFDLEGQYTWNKSDIPQHIPSKIDNIVPLELGSIQRCFSWDDVSQKILNIKSL